MTTADTTATKRETEPKETSSLPPNIRPSLGGGDPQRRFAGSEQNTATTSADTTPPVRASLPLTPGSGLHKITAGSGQNIPAPTIYPPKPTQPASVPSDPGSHSRGDIQDSNAAGQPSSNPANVRSLPNDQTPGLLDPTLALLADVLDDLERTRIANENRLRQLTRTGVDKDGEERGFGLDESHPAVARLAGVVDGIAALEHQATLNLNRAMRKHPLGAWVKTQRGVGEKQAARLLAAIGDPYFNTLHDRPRTVSELWAYCGLHVIRADQTTSGVQVRVVGAERTGGNPDQTGTANTQPSTVRVAAKRRRGERANWSTAAKMRSYLIAESMLRAGNRDTYDQRKAATEGKLHATPCVRCGPSGKPAQPGTPWSDGHRHADALRITSKALLKDLWRAARDIHLGHSDVADQFRNAGVEQS